MGTTKKNTTEKSKRTYTEPQIEKIQLDNEISLIMQSSPAVNPDEGYLQENFNVDPLKNGMC